MFSIEVQLIGRHSNVIHIFTLLPLLHQSVSRNLLCKIDEVGRVAPWFNPLLLLDGLREERAPLQTRVSLVDLGPRNVVEQLFEIPDVRVEAGVVVGGSELKQLAKERDRAIHTHVLVSNDRLGSSLGLVGGRSKVLQDIHGLDAPVDIKRHASRSKVFLRGTKIVE